MDEFESFMEDPYWRFIYNNASDVVKQVLKIDMTYGTRNMPKEKQLEEQAIWDLFTEKDWQYYFDHNFNPNGKVYYRQTHRYY